MIIRLVVVHPQSEDGIILDGRWALLGPSVLWHAHLRSPRTCGSSSGTALITNLTAWTLQNKPFWLERTLRQKNRCTDRLVLEVPELGNHGREDRVRKSPRFSPLFLLRRECAAQRAFLSSFLFGDVSDKKLDRYTLPPALGMVFLVAKEPSHIGTTISFWLGLGWSGNRQGWGKRVLSHTVLKGRSPVVSRSAGRRFPGCDEARRCL